MRTNQWVAVLLIASVIITALIVRLIHLEAWFYYMFDEEVISYVAQRLVVEHHFPLIGGVTPLRFHLGPFFYYFSAFWLWVGHMHPVYGWGILAALLATVTVILIYAIGTMLYNRTAGLFASLLAATSYLLILLDRHYWPLTLNPLLTCIVFFCLIKIKQNRSKFIWPLTGALIFASHMDPSAFVLIVLTVFVWWKAQLPVSGDKVKLAVLLFLLSMVPLLAFELRHDFYNTKHFFSFFAEPKNSFAFRTGQFTETLLLFPRVFARITWPFEPHEVTSQLTFCKEFIQERFSAVGLWVWPSATVLAAWMGSLWRRRRDFEALLFLSLLGIVFVGVNIYSNLFNADLYEQYLTPILPVLFVGLGRVAAFLWQRNRWVTLFVIAQLVISNLTALFLGTNRFGWEAKWQATQFALETVGSQPFALAALGRCHRYGGFRYLFTLAGKDPAWSYVDGELGYLYGKKLTDPPPLWVVMVAPEKGEGGDFMDQYNHYKRHEQASKRFGDLEVIIARIQ